MSNIEDPTSAAPTLINRGPTPLQRFKADIFQALANPTRIAILEVLREGEVSAGTIIERLGVEQSNISQHLAVLRGKHLVTGRKEGNQVFYRLRDPLIGDVLDIMRRYFQAHMADSMALLSQINNETSDPL